MISPILIRDVNGASLVKLGNWIYKHIYHFQVYKEIQLGENRTAKEILNFNAWITTIYS